MKILHGENQVLSRKALGDLKENESKAGKEVIVLSGDFELVELKQAVESNSLFGVDKVVVVENLLSAKTNKRQNEIVEYLKKEKIDNLIIWEGKELTPTVLKQFKAEPQIFKISPEIFKLMDSLKSKNEANMLVNLQRCLKSEEIELVFYMFCRQVRMMIQTKGEKGLLKGHPFVVEKVKKQAESFSLEKLLELHRKLYEIDKRQKTGATPLPLIHEIEMWMMEI